MSSISSSSATASGGFGEIRENVAYLTGLQPHAVRQGIGVLVRALDSSRTTRRSLPSSRACASMPPPYPAHSSTPRSWTGPRAPREFLSPSCRRRRSASSIRPTRPCSSPTTRFCAPRPSTMSRAASATSRCGSVPAPCARTAPASAPSRLFGARMSSPSMPTEPGARRRSPTWANWPARSAYAEQPIAAGDWRPPAPGERFSRSGHARREPRLGRIDASAASGKLWAHLKLIKLGGITPTIERAAPRRRRHPVHDRPDERGRRGHRGRLPLHHRHQPGPRRALRCRRPGRRSRPRRQLRRWQIRIEPRARPRRPHRHPQSRDDFGRSEHEHSWQPS